MQRFEIHKSEFVIVQRLVLDLHISAAAKLVLGKLVSLSGNTGYTTVGDTWLAEDLGLHRNAVRKVINELAASGYLSVTQVGQRGRQIEVCIPAPHGTDGKKPDLPEGAIAHRMCLSDRPEQAHSGVEQAHSGVEQAHSGVEQAHSGVEQAHSGVSRLDGLEIEETRLDKIRTTAVESGPQFHPTAEPKPQAEAPSPKPSDQQDLDDGLCAIIGFLNDARQLANLRKTAGEFGYLAATDRHPELSGDGFREALEPLVASPWSPSQADIRSFLDFRGYLVQHLGRACSCVEAASFILAALSTQQGAKAAMTNWLCVRRMGLQYTVKLGSKDGGPDSYARQLAGTIDTLQLNLDQFIEAAKQCSPLELRKQSEEELAAETAAAAAARGAAREQRKSWMSAMFSQEEDNLSEGTKLANEEFLAKYSRSRPVYA